MSDDRPTDPTGNDSDFDRPPNPDDEALQPEAAPTTGTPQADVAPAVVGAPKPLRTRMLVGIAGVVLVLDLITKIAVVEWITPGNPIEIIGDFVTLRLVRNAGAAFSMATSMTWLLTIVAVCVVIGVIRIGRTLRSPWWALGLGLVLGGALGNLVDRFFRAPGPLQGHVVDFVSVGRFPVFNVADSSIVCGAILLVVLSLAGFEPNGERLRSKNDTDAKSTDAKTADTE